MRTNRTRTWLALSSFLLAAGSGWGCGVEPGTDDGEDTEASSASAITFYPITYQDSAGNYAYRTGPGAYRVKCKPPLIAPVITLVDPVFQMDCSRIAGRETECQQLLVNAACRVYPAYRQITDTRLEPLCSTVQYVIYPDLQPGQSNESTFGCSGLNGNTSGGCSYVKSDVCHISYQAQYGLQVRSTTLGPVDTHELLHHFQHQVAEEAGASSWWSTYMPVMHSLFASSQPMAARMVDGSPTGDLAEFFSQQISDEADSLQARIANGTLTPSDANYCPLMLTYVEETLAVHDWRFAQRVYTALAAVDPGISALSRETEALRNAATAAQAAGEFDAGFDGGAWASNVLFSLGGWGSCW